MASRSVVIKFKNATPEALKLTDAKLQSGVWSQNMYPPDEIEAGAEVAWESESDGFMTGTEGACSYLMKDSHGSTRISWDNPFSGSNKYSASVPGGYTCNHTGGGENNATVTFTLHPTAS